jgi:branched-chain amino acid transport system substrate-binding protein
MSKARRRLLAISVTLVLLAGAAVAAAKFTGLFGRASTATIGVDLPFQGASSDDSTQTFNAMKLYLDRIGGKVGDTTVSLFSYDDSTTENITGDPARCTENANAHIARADEVAVIGPNSVACARAEAKLLAGAGMVMISPTVTNPGLTTAWGPGEPDAYTASGVRGFARVVPTDDEQAAAAAQFAARTAGVHHCLVLSDGELYGSRLAQRFFEQANAAGVTVIDRGTWDRTRLSYTDLFPTSSGIDCVFLAGNFDNNGEQLVTDKVSTLGDNDRVKLLVPDGFGLYPAFVNLPAAQHAYTTTPGLTMDGWRSLHGNVDTFLTAYHDRYQSDLTAPQALYGVLALQVVLRAIEASDPTRAAVHRAVFEATGVSVPARTCITGSQTGIVPQTGDVTAPAVTMAQLNNGTVTFAGTATPS